MLYSVEACVTNSAGIVEVRNYHWHTPLDEVVVDDVPVFGLSLSPVPSGSRACFGNTDRQSSFGPIGSMLYRPAGMPMHCRNAGGHQRLLMCTTPAATSSLIASELIGQLDGLPPLLDARDGGIGATLRRLATEVCAPGFASAALVEALITTLLADFLRLARPDAASPGCVKGGLAPWQFRRIDEALHDLDGAAPSVTDLARSVGVSPRHLLRAFRTSMGMSVTQHVAQVRVERASGLLASTSLPIKEIAARCGFASASTFAAAFQRETGLTPRGYRARTTYCVRSPQ